MHGILRPGERRDAECVRRGGRRRPLAAVRRLVRGVFGDRTYVHGHDERRYDGGRNVHGLITHTLTHRGRQGPGCGADAQRAGGEHRFDPQGWGLPCGVQSSRRRHCADRLVPGVAECAHRPRPQAAARGQGRQDVHQGRQRQGGQKLALTAKGSFTPEGGKKTSKQKSFALKR
jgi:hypothetical protein